MKTVFVKTETYSVGGEHHHFSLKAGWLPGPYYDVLLYMDLLLFMDTI